MKIRRGLDKAPTLPHQFGGVGDEESMVGQGAEKPRAIKNRALPHIAPGFIIPLGTGLGSTYQKSLLCKPTNTVFCFVKRNATCAESIKKI